ncbi:MAG: SiaB family protein kinase, partial [Bacteroidota bacterium]|nr:SiaB family protein kinase [Bacteroidota bacterium]
MNPLVSFAFYKKLENDNSSFIYQADFNDDITSKILRLSENNIDNLPELSKIKNKVSFLMAECFQNIIHHSDKPVIKNATNNLPEMFMVRNIGNSFFISSTNLIENTKVENIKSQLENINKLNKEELKELYLKVLTNEDYSNKGGAGLGMIEMARKSGNNLIFDFEFINYFLSLFHLQLKLSKGDSNEENIQLSHTKEIHDIMYSDNILLVYKGDFSQQTILPILSMIEQNLDRSANIKKKVYYLLVELLQNISKHGTKKK